LLQQGKQKFYFTQYIKNNVKVIPCYYFNLLIDKEVGGFNHLSFNPVMVNTTSDKKLKLLPKNNINADIPEEIKTISPGRLNDYIKCPKKYAFSILIPGEDSQVFKKGILLHNFAELYVNHKEFTKNNLQTIIDLMIEKLSYFMKDFNMEFFNTEFMIGTDAIINFIDSAKINLFNLDEPKDPEDNELMKELNKKIVYANTEHWIIDTEITKIKGKIDLQYGNTIVDYKSSKTRKFETDVTLQSNLTYIMEKEKEDFDFQAVSYVAAMRNYHNEINFIYNYLLSNLRNQINPLQRSETNLTRIRYLPQTFFEYILSKEVFEKLKKKEKFELFLETIGYMSYKFILKNINLEQKHFFDQKIVEDKIISVGNNLVFNTLGYTTGDFKKNNMRTFTNDIMKPFACAIHNIRIGKTETGFIFKDDIEKFLTLIKDKIELINKYQLSTFPFAPIYNSRDVCKECNYLNICIGNKLWN
ncbi:MAG: PD-(D/E)XK nuclease family protein, partial [Bacteroidota bacterium]|nr:PD-(D/E)XK nuclease family protein [Bacteroidota bacterium]